MEDFANELDTDPVQADCNVSMNPPERRCQGSHEQGLEHSGDEGISPGVVADSPVILTNHEDDEFSNDPADAEEDIDEDETDFDAFSKPYSPPSSSHAASFL